MVLPKQKLRFRGSRSSKTGTKWAKDRPKTNLENNSEKTLFFSDFRSINEPQKEPQIIQKQIKEKVQTLYEYEWI